MDIKGKKPNPTPHPAVDLKTGVLTIVDSSALQEHKSFSNVTLRGKAIIQM